jgi:hypothetical protein
MSRDAEIKNVVRRVLDELFFQRTDVLQDYVSTKGDTDWVWLEESLSLYLNEDAHTDRMDDYLEAFKQASDAIRAIYPEVKPPRWFMRETSALGREGAQLLIAAGEDPSLVASFISDAGINGYLDDDNQNSYGDVEDVVEDFHNFKLRYGREER